MDGAEDAKTFTLLQWFDSWARSMCEKMGPRYHFSVILTTGPGPVNLSLLACFGNWLWV